MLAANEEFEISSKVSAIGRKNQKLESLTTWGTSSSNAESGIGSDDNISELFRKQENERFRSKNEIRHHEKAPVRKTDSRKTENNVITPWNLIREYELPQLVLVYNTVSSRRGDGGKMEARENSLGNEINFSEPFLLYKKYESVKISARSLKSLENGKLVETGPEVIIPNQYNGWFSLLIEAKKPTPHYTVVSQLLANRIGRFLTGLRLLAYRLEQPPGKRSQYIPISIPGGQTLRVLAVFQEVRGIALPVTEPGMKPVIEKRFAQCFTQAHQVVFIPMCAQGHFYTVASRSSKSESFVYSLKQLLSIFTFPIDVRLVSGPLPNKPPNFTGLLRLQAIKKSEVILACNVTELENPRMLEIDTHSGWCLRRVPAPERKNKKWFSAYERSLALCRDRGDAWRRQIKASLPVFPDARAHSKLIESALCDHKKLESTKSDIPKRKFGLDFKIGSPVNIVRPLFGRNSFSKIDGSCGTKHPIRDVPSMCSKPPDLIENISKRLSISRLSMSSGCDSDTSSIGHGSRNKLKNLMKFRSKSEQPPKDLLDIDEGILSPYGKVADDLCLEDEEENIYAEISDFADLESSYL